MNILQVGFGNFGKRHLEAWYRLGFGEHLRIVESDECKWRDTGRYNFPRSRMFRSMAETLDWADIVDIVTPTESHFVLCCQALDAGKDVFIEKPMTMNLKEAHQVFDLVQKTNRLIQVGYYYRYHPMSQYLRSQIKSGRFGKIRYLSGNFMGFKRARTDVGVTHTDGIHFLDLFNWLLDNVPLEVYAVCRDHFGRGLEDFSLVLLTYPGGTVAKVESGYIQPGRWKDKVVPGALTTKEIVVVGERGAGELDFECETFTFYDAHHELKNGVWTAVVGGVTRIPLDPCDPVQMICHELNAFIKNVESREQTTGGALECGVHLAALMDCIYESAHTGSPVKVRLS